MAETRDILNAILRKLIFKQDLSGLRMLITAGPTLEYIDPIRVITNRSSGKMGVAIAEDALNRGAKITFIYGPMMAAPASEASLIRVETTEQMREAVVSELESKKYDAVIAVAAPADWTLEEAYSRKVSTREPLNLEFKPTIKIINHVKKIDRETFLVAFRAEYNLSEKDLIESAYEKLLESDADLIIVNDVSKKGAGFGTDTNEVFILDKEKEVIHVPLAPKLEVARKILDVVNEKIDRL